MSTPPPRTATRKGTGLLGRTPGVQNRSLLQWGISQAIEPLWILVSLFLKETEDPDSRVLSAGGLGHTYSRIQSFSFSCASHSLITSCIRTVTPECESPACSGQTHDGCCEAPPLVLGGMRNAAYEPGTTSSKSSVTHSNPGRGLDSQWPVFQFFGVCCGIYPALQRGFHF